MELLQIGDLGVDLRLTAPEAGLLAEAAEVLAGAISCQGRTADSKRLEVLGETLGDAERALYLLTRLPWLGHRQAPIVTFDIPSYAAGVALGLGEVGDDRQ